MAKSRRSYKGAAVANTIGTLLTSTGTTITLGSAMSGWPTGSEPFFCVIEPGTAREEKVCVKYASSNSLTVVDPAVTSTWSSSVNGRGVDDTQAFEHAVNSVIYPVLTAREMNDANELTSAYTTNGDLVVHGSTSFKKIAAGTNNYVLMADSSVSDGGVKWGQVVADSIATGAVTSAKILDGTIALGDLATVLQNALPPVGTIAPYAGTSAPTGWLLCNGGAINASYTGLIALVGANTPNLKGKFLVGLDSTVSNFDALGNAIDSIGDTGGVATVTLTSAQSGVPAHSHPNTATASSTSTSTTSISDPTHRHSFSGTTGSTTQAATQGFAGTGAAAGFMTNTNIDAVSSTANLSSHDHSFSGNTSYEGTGITASTSTSTTTTVTMSNQNNTAANAASAHTNIPPYYTVNYIIKHDYL